MTAAGPLDLCHIVAPGPVGGLESVVAMHAAGMARRGHRVRVLALLEPAGRCDAFQGLPGDGVGVVEIRLPAGSYREEVRRLAGLLSGGRLSVAHCHGYHADLVGWRAARRARRPVVSTVHGYTGGGVKNRLYEWLDRLALRHLDAVIAVSRPLERQLSAAGVRSSRLHCIPNALAEPAPAPDRAAARRALGLEPGGLVAGWVGRLSVEKGPDLFLEALARAPEWRASIVGDGPLRGALEARARDLGVDRRIRWHGVVPGAGTLLAGFDALVLSSRTEGTPIVLLEAMAAGVPLVVTEVGGVPDVVTASEAIRVPPGRPEALAEALHQLQRDPAGAGARARAAGTRLASVYAIGPWLDRHEALYRSLPGMTPERAAAP